MTLRRTKLQGDDKLPGAAVAMFRTYKQLSMKELAWLAKINQSSLSSIENMHLVLTARVAVNLARVLEIPPEALLFPKNLPTEWVARVEQFTNDPKTMPRKFVPGLTKFRALRAHLARTQREEDGRYKAETKGPTMSVRTIQASAKKQTNGIIVDTPSFCPKWEFVTPEIAEKYLATSVGNRSLSDALVIDIATAMDSGNYYPTHQGIAFDEQGRIRDGHHRLKSIILAGHSVWILVTRGLPNVACEVVDGGRARSVRDVIQIGAKLGVPEHVADVQNASVRVAAYRAMASLSSATGRQERSSMATYNKNKRLYSAAIEGFEKTLGSLSIGLPSESNRGLRMSGMHIAAFAYAWEPFPAEIEEFTAWVRAGDVYRPIVKQALNVMIGYHKHNMTENILLAHRILRILAAHVTGEDVKTDKPAAVSAMGYDFFRRAREARGMLFTPWVEDPAKNASNMMRHFFRCAEQGVAEHRPLTNIVTHSGETIVASRRLVR